MSDLLFLSNEVAHSYFTLPYLKINDTTQILTVYLMLLSICSHFFMNGGTTVEDLLLLLRAHKSMSVSGLLKPVKISLQRVDNEEQEALIIFIIYCVFLIALALNHFCLLQFP